MHVLAQHENFKLHETCDFDISGLDAVVVGTSNSGHGKKYENTIRLRACQMDIPLVVIEDFPGNYNIVQDGNPDLLIVEHPLVRELHQQRLGKLCPDITVIPNPRYDHLRASADNLHMKMASHWYKYRENYSVLWAGQPETEDATMTLSRVIPVLREMGLQLLFKAHPRDAGYSAGAYNEIASGMDASWKDVTNLGLSECLSEYAPRVILTQSSSLAIEAGFYGIPAANVLFCDAGGKRLQTDKGFSVPPWCASGAAMAIQDIGEIQDKLHLLLFDENFRRVVNTKFLEWFGIESSSPKVVEQVLKLVGTTT
jgi:hypothetical protein